MTAGPRKSAGLSVSWLIRGIGVVVLAGPVFTQSQGDPERVALPARSSARPATRVVRLHGVVEPVRSHTVSTPRLTGGGPGGPGGPPGQLIVVRLAPAGTLVKKGDLLVEFDRTNQLRAARDRDAEYREAVEQINRRRGEILTARALRDTQLKQGKNDVAIARLGVVGNEDVGSIAAEKNVQTLEEATARLNQLTKTFALRQEVELADMKILEIRLARARNALQHAEGNAERMRIASPIDGLVVLRSVFRSGTMAEIREGEEVRPGVPILDVVDPSAMRIRVNVNQADVEGLVAGQQASITLDSYPARQFEGRLEQLSPIASTSMLSNRVRTFAAVFAVDGNDPHLLPDLAAAVEIVRSDK
jgi:HlyD family secretion protein